MIARVGGGEGGGDRCVVIFLSHNLALTRMSLRGLSLV